MADFLAIMFLAVQRLVTDIITGICIRDVSPARYLLNFLTAKTGLLHGLLARPALSLMARSLTSVLAARQILLAYRVALQQLVSAAQ